MIAWLLWEAGIIIIVSSNAKNNNSKAASREKLREGREIILGESGRYLCTTDISSSGIENMMKFTYFNHDCIFDIRIRKGISAGIKGATSPF